MGCGAVAGGVDTSGIDLSTQAVIRGVVTRAEQPVSGAYVRLLDRTGEFTADVPTSSDGGFRFFATDGEWTLRTLAPGSDPVDRQVRAAVGAVTDVRVTI
jgi:hypothetical protein